MSVFYGKTEHQINEYLFSQLKKGSVPSLNEDFLNLVGQAYLYKYDMAQKEPSSLIDKLRSFKISKKHTHISIARNLRDYRQEYMSHFERGFIYEGDDSPNEQLAFNRKTPIDAIINSLIRTRSANGWLAAILVDSVNIVLDTGKKSYQPISIYKPGHWLSGKASARSLSMICTEIFLNVRQWKKQWFKLRAEQRLDKRESILPVEVSETDTPAVPVMINGSSLLFEQSDSDFEDNAWPQETPGYKLSSSPEFVSVNHEMDKKLIKEDYIKEPIQPLKYTSLAAVIKKTDDHQVVLKRSSLQQRAGAKRLSQPQTEQGQFTIDQRLKFFERLTSSSKTIDAHPEGNEDQTQMSSFSIQ